MQNQGQTKISDEIAIRVRFANRAEVYVRRKDIASGDGYAIGITGGQNVAAIARIDGKENRANLVPPVDVRPILTDGYAHELVPTAVGEKLSLWLDGKLLLTAADSTYKSGINHVSLPVRHGSPAPRIKKVEIGALRDCSTGNDAKMKAWEEEG